VLKYLLFLLGGAVLGLTVRGEGVRRAQRVVMPASILVLLFFMGVGIGKDPDLGRKIASFGVNALCISGLSVAFSVLFVYALVRLLGPRP